MQNILMCKLGIVRGPHVEAADFDHYLWLFKEGLTEEQVQMVRDMFAFHEPIPVKEGVVAEEVES
jgi:hypothetical protein